MPGVASNNWESRSGPYGHQKKNPACVKEIWPPRVATDTQGWELKPY
jgi:hypothetical protein